MLDEVITPRRQTDSREIPSTLRVCAIQTCNPVVAALHPLQLELVPFEFTLEIDEPDVGSKGILPVDLSANIALHRSISVDEIDVSDVSKLGGVRVSEIMRDNLFHGSDLGRTERRVDVVIWRCRASGQGHDQANENQAAHRETPGLRHSVRDRKRKQHVKSTRVANCSLFGTSVQQNNHFFNSAMADPIPSVRLGNPCCAICSETLSSRKDNHHA